MLTIFVTAPILIAVFLFVFSSRRAARLVAIAAQAALTGVAVYLFIASRTETLVANIGHYESVLGITLRADDISAMFVLLATLIFLAVSVYSLHEQNSRLFWFLLFIWESALIGLFLTRDIFNRFVLMEVVSIIITVLILYKRKKRSMYDGLIFFMLNIVASFFFLLGIGYFYSLTGVLDMDAATATLATLDNAQMLLPYALIMTFVLFKCAIFPLSRWFSAAVPTEGAPSDVSGILAGVNMISGLYLFLRIQSVFALVAMRELFLFLGVIAGVAGAAQALAHTDIKRVLTHCGLAQLGLIMVVLNTDGVDYLYPIITYALLQAALFLIVGMIVFAYGTRDMTQIRGVLRRCPILGGFILLTFLGLIATQYAVLLRADTAARAVILLIFLVLNAAFVRFGSILFGKSCPDCTQFYISKQLAVFIICAIYFISAVLFPMQARAFGAVDHLVNLALLAGAWGAAYLLQRYVSAETSFLRHAVRVELSFKGTCAAMGGVFALILVAAYLIG
ncbi:MAG: hypothetical protein FWE06_10085 [Oscillospiraceae bacterium]|nr:hypothetical protein [Oscillospiraceae bacterium]